MQWAYLGIALFVVILALIFFYLPIPEASDEELESLARKQRTSTNGSDINTPMAFGGIPMIYLTLLLGVFSQFCYVGSQEAVASFYQQYITLVDPNSSTSPFYYQAVGHTVFALGRFLTAALNLYIKPRRILLFLFLACIVTTALATHVTGPAGTAMLVLTLLFESGIFSLVFAISVRGMGRQTKWAAVFLTAATSGGAVVPAIMNPVMVSRGLQYAFVVTVAVFAFGLVFPAYLALVPSAKRQVDPVRSEKGPVLGHEERRGASKRGSKLFHDLVRRRKGGGSEGSSDGPSIEHVESTGRRAERQMRGAGQLDEKGEEEPPGMRLAPWPT